MTQFAGQDYSVLAAPFADRPDVLWRKVWFTVPWENPWLDSRMHCQMDLKYLDYWPHTAGEVANTKRRWTAGAPFAFRPVAGQVCGTREQWLGNVGTSARYVPVDPDTGVAVCCNAWRYSAGGAAAGGTSFPLLIHAETSAGGGLASGSAAETGPAAGGAGTSTGGGLASGSAAETGPAAGGTGTSTGGTYAGGEGTETGPAAGGTGTSTGGTYAGGEGIDT